MVRSTKIWHPNYTKYTQEIIAHPNYENLAIEYKQDGSPVWLAPAQTAVGLRRIEWAEAEAKKLDLKIESGVFAKVMYSVHPTKMKACQVCGISMSISYIYPNVNFAKALIKTFAVDIDIYDSIYDVWDNIIKQGHIDSEIISLINDKFKTSFLPSTSKDEVLIACEKRCRVEGVSHLGPGAMSNFPDRFDGFHSYNRCHRGSEDKGRSKENMKTYTRDRRAYEYWSDGNTHAANRFMGSKYFAGVSADHVGPISLGFVHDSHYLRPMTGSDNSAKRDRLDKDIIDQVLAIQAQTGIYPMSWYSSVIWDYIVENYETNESKISGVYRNLLKQNMTNYMYILMRILSLGEVGSNFLVRNLISPNADDYLYDYEFDSLGNIVSKSGRNITKRAHGELDRFIRLSIAAVYEYNDKENRNLAPDLTIDEVKLLTSLTILVTQKKNSEALEALRGLLVAVQLRSIGSE